MTMTPGSAFLFFGIMIFLAALPSSSVLIVITRSATSGLIHGVSAALGIVTGDLIFILIAVLGLTFLAGSLGDLFVLVKYFAAAYLLWLAISMWRSGSVSVSTVTDGAVTDSAVTKNTSGENHMRDVKTSLLSSYLSGLLFTLADQKAVIFYLGLFPAFINLSDITSSDIAIIVLITIVAVGGVKITYAFIADRTVALFDSNRQQMMKRFAAGLMLTIAIYIAFSA